MSWLDTEIDGKIYKNLLIIGIGLIVLYSFMFATSFVVPRVYKLSEETVIDDENMIKNGISRLNVGKKVIELEGWAYKEGESVNTYECYFVLKGNENDKMYILKTINKTVDALAVVDEKYNCLNCGMYTKNLIVGIQKGVYDLYILYKNNGENILANTTLSFEIK